MSSQSFSTILTVFFMCLGLSWEIGCLISKILFTYNEINICPPYTLLPLQYLVKRDGFSKENRQYEIYLMNILVLVSGLHFICCYFIVYVTQPFLMQKQKIGTLKIIHQLRSSPFIKIDSSSTVSTIAAKLLFFTNL